MINIRAGNHYMYSIKNHAEKKYAEQCLRKELGLRNDYPRLVRLTPYLKTRITPRFAMNIQEMISKIVR